MSNTTVNLVLNLKGQQAQQVLNQLNQTQKNTSNELLRTNRLIEGTLRQQSQHTKLQSQQLQQLNRITQQNAKNLTQTASQTTATLNTNRLLERVLEQQTRQTTIQSQQLRQQNRDYQIQVNMLRQQVAAAARLREELRGARNEQQQAARSGGLLQTTAGVAGGAYAAGMIGSNYLKDPRDYMRQISLSTDTALAGQKLSIPQFNQKVTEMSGFARNAAVAGGSSPQQVAQALNTLTASNVYDFKDYKDVLYQVSKTAFSSGADANDVASMAVAQKNFGLTNLSRANDMAFRSGQLGSFELRDMARYMPDILTQGKNAGYVGENGYRNLLTMMQMSKKTAGTSESAAVNLSDLLGSFSQYHLGLQFAKFVKLDKGDPIAKYGVSKKRAGFDWTTYAANMREQGVGEVEAAALLMQRQMSKNPLYMEYQAKAQKAAAESAQKKQLGLSTTQEDAIYKENLQAATSIVGQSEIGKIFHNKQALLSFMGITMNMGKGGAYEVVDQGTASSSGAVDESHARQASQEYAKDGSLDTARFNARLDVYNGVADKLGKFKQDLADYASSHNEVAAAASAATVSLMGLAAAGGIAALTMRGGGGLSRMGGMAAGAGKWLRRGAAPVTLGLGAYGLYETANNENLTTAQRNIAQTGIVGGTAGALAGATAGGYGGAALGTAIFPGVGTVIGGAVGSLAGGIAGYWGGSSGGEAFAEYFNKQHGLMDEQTKAIETQTKTLENLINQPLQVNVNLEGENLMRTLERKIMQDSNRQGSVPFFLQRR